MGGNRQTTEGIRAEVVAARRDLVALLETLAPSDWDKPTLCAGWKVRDVASHVARLPDLKTRKVWAGLVRSRGNTDSMIDRMAVSGGKRDPEEILENLRRNVDSHHLPARTTAETALVDVVVHSLDISYPNGWDVNLPADRARLALSTLVTLAGPFRGRQRAAGLHLDTTDIDWRCGCGDDVRGSAPVMLLALAGRPVCDRLHGKGTGELAERC